MSEERRPLPELQSQDVDADTLRALVRDVLALGEDLEVLVKGGAVEHANAAPPDPHTALEGLLSGRWRGVQLRYRFEGRDWLDTLMRLPTGFRIVRMAPDWDVSGG